MIKIRFYKIFFLIVLLFITSKVWLQSTAKFPLIPVKLAESYGYIDYDGNLVIPYQYSYAKPFSDGLAMVAMNGKYGFVNPLGQVVIPIKYESAYPFKHHKAVVGEQGQWSVVDTTGKILINRNAYDVELISDYLNLIDENKLKNTVLIARDSLLHHIHIEYDSDKNGNYLFSNKKGKFGVIGKNGAVIIPAKYSEDFNKIGNYYIAPSLKRGYTKFIVIYDINGNIIKILRPEKNSFFTRLGIYEFAPFIFSIEEVTIHNKDLTRKIYAVDTLVNITCRPYVENSHYAVEAPQDFSGGARFKIMYDNVNNFYYLEYPSGYKKELPVGPKYTKLQNFIVVMPPPYTNYRYSGLMDESLKMIYEPKFAYIDSSRTFSGIIEARTNDSITYINTKGKIIYTMSNQ